jgi:transketolase
MNKRNISGMRPFFADCISEQMKEDSRIYVVVNDLGYGMWDTVRRNFPDRFINVGAAEQTLIGVGVGLAISGKIPIVYSITSFLLYRPFETIRNYLHNDRIPVKLIGSGRGREYSHDGFSHWVDEDREIMAVLSNITSSWPENTDELPKLVARMLKKNKPWYINLKR